MKKEILIAGTLLGYMVLCAGQARAVLAKNGDGNMTVSPTTINAGDTNTFVFSFVSPKKTFSVGSQATLKIPQGWSAPQTSDPSGPGFISVTPVLSGSTAAVSGIGGNGPWTVTIGFSTTQKKGGFTLNYSNARASTNASVYWFTAQDEQNGGVFKNLKSGSPSVTVDNPAKI